jgi:preprotein translocase subunit SecD
MVQVVPHSSFGYSLFPIPPDPTFSAYPSSSGTKALSGSTELMDGTAFANSTNGLIQHRYLVGPVVLSKSAIASATAARNPQGEWQVDLRLNHQGAEQWDRATRTHFHQYLAIVINSKVAQASLVEPAQASWSTFGGQVVIGTGWFQGYAEEIAADLNPPR